MKPWFMIVLLAITSLCPAEGLRVVCSVPDLADLVKNIGGDRVTVTALARSRDNPHFLSARPSFIRQVASADAVVAVGLDLEIGWMPALTASARNRRVMPGQPGYLDCSAAVQALEIPTGTLDRSQGDVHPLGNPHYLLNPACGIQVTLWLGQQFAALDPDGATIYQKQALAYATTLAEELYGETIAAAHSPAELVRWHTTGTLAQHIDEASLGGWMKQLAPLQGTGLVDDHSQWPYLAQCFNLKIAGHLEPKAGVPPSSSHLKKIISVIQEQSVAALIAAPWFDPRHAQTVAKATGIPVLQMGHQVGSLPNTETYLDLCSSNVATLATLLPAKTEVAE